MKKILRPLLLMGLLGVASTSFAIDTIPLDQLKSGRWKVERKIEKLDLSPVEHETRNSEYCASPKKEIMRTQRIASFICKTDVSQLAENKFSIRVSACKIPGISGENTTIITLVSPTEYTAQVDTIGTKFGEKQHRKEMITAVRVGDCQE